ARMCRSLIPTISAACHQVIFLAMACNITSLYFHCPLHRGLRVRIHASHGLLSSPPAKRTYHLLSQPDISCATDTAKSFTLTSLRREDSLCSLCQGCGPNARASPEFSILRSKKRCTSRLQGAPL